MSNNGGAGYGPNEPTSFGLQPPQPQQPYAGNPYAQPTPPTQAAPQPAQGVPPQLSSPSPAPAPSPSQDEPGTGRLVAGRYRLLSKLGHGGMGTVWRAKDETVDREVAVKEPRLPDHLPERERANAFERMRREARAAARLDHPAVVNVHDVAVEDGQPWIVMEFVQGRSLGGALQEGTIGVRDAARIGLEVLGALEAAHAAGILHRDVKPDNVLLGRHDRVILTDFGIAQIEGETNLTDTGGFVGSPEFIAPERVLGQRPGPASDLWSLGVVLYAATEGVSPFRRSNTPATLQSVLNATPAAPASAQGPLADAINGLLQKDPARRPNAAQVRALLERAAEPPAPQPTQVVRIGPAQGGLRLGRKALIGIGAGVVAVAVAAYLVLADPFAGPLPDGWKQHAEKNLGITVAVPQDYQVSRPTDTDTDKNWVKYTDWSGSVWVGVNLSRKKDDTLNQIKGSARAQMYDDDTKFKNDGSIDLDMPDGAKTRPDDDAKYQDQDAAQNTVSYDTDDSDNPRPREIRFFYYKNKDGDMYRVTISYPGKGDFTERGREVADDVIANLDIAENL
ncbi:serine/threonine-protein kinase [Streptomyces longispororuber]|uniref:serine/threonine-protein kinase n=1 Tax=Streptomyces longispororuber TaxID=68230 RepID=UPI002108B02B|nr:serine/threonine-protein kinase [Streptomyces longispororuber]MCQ4210473.1 serine/threonine protein kinase [Streptomyces longispororuber]